MGNCLAWKKPKRAISICMVGLDNAGKTTAVKGVQGGSVFEVAPTIGFSSVDIKSGNFAVTLIDLGGGRRIRDIWKNYLAEVYAVIFVLDSSDAERLGESGEEFKKLLGNPLVQGKPVLLLANKQDKEGALNEPTICEALDLHELVNEFKCPCRVELCAAITSKPGRRNVDKNLRSGFEWLLQAVEKQFPILEEKVREDTSRQDEEERIKSEERRERVRKVREERERREREEKGETIETPTNENPLSSARSLRSGLGDQLVDDDDDITMPGAVIEEDSCTESQQRVSSRLSRDTCATGHDTCATPSQAVVECSSSASSLGNGKLTKKNKIAPINDVSTMGKLAPLNSLPKDPSFKNTLDYAPLPALNKPKPNFDSDEDIVV